MKLSQYSYIIIYIFIQIRIEAVIGSSWKGDIAIDDLTLNAGECFSNALFYRLNGYS